MQAMVVSAALCCSLITAVHGGKWFSPTAAAARLKGRIPSNGYTLDRDGAYTYIDHAKDISADSDNGLSVPKLRTWFVRSSGGVGVGQLLIFSQLEFITTGGSRGRHHCRLCYRFVSSTDGYKAVELADSPNCERSTTKDENVLNEQHYNTAFQALFKTTLYQE